MKLAYKDIKVLVLEDSSSAMLDITTKLKKICIPMNILQAFNFEDAVSIVNQTPIDIAIVDLSMPGDKNGMDFIIDFMKSNKNTRKVPIIVVTSSGSDTLLKNALEGIVKKYLVKPVVPNQLQTCIEEVLAKSKNQKNENSQSIHHF